MQIKKVTDRDFKKYGKILENYDFKELLDKMAEIDMPEDSVIYKPSDELLEGCKVMHELKNQMYGGLPIQIGYCNGNNRKLNAVEYHRTSELDIAANDLILLLGKQEDIREDYTYDTSNIEAFFLPANVGVELYATTLHYAPCTAEGEAGFKCVIVLPESTNMDIDFKLADGESRLMAAKNKWLIAHEEAGIAGAFCGLIGENIEI